MVAAVSWWRALCDDESVIMGDGRPPSHSAPVVPSPPRGLHNEGLFVPRADSTRFRDPASPFFLVHGEKQPSVRGSGATMGPMRTHVSVSRYNSRRAGGQKQLVVDIASKPGDAARAALC
ncbi:hypothetical protein MRX96_032650 [Rhipicephalus microplus]